MFKSRLIAILLVLFNFNAFSQSWNRLAKSPNAGLNDIIFLNKAKGFVLSEDRVLLTTDSGKSWSQVLSTYSGFSRIKFMDNKIGFIIGKNDLVLKTVDGGNNWSLKQTGNSKADFTSTYLINKDTVFVLGAEDADKSLYSSYINYTYNGGDNWFRKALNTLQDIPGFVMWNKNSGVAGTRDSGVFSTQNGFQSYSVNLKAGITLSDISVVRDSIVLLIGTGGVISRSIDSGKTFTAISSPVTENLNRIHFCNDSVGMACGNNGTIILTKDAGKTWSKMSIGTTQDFTGIYVLNPYLAWAITFSTQGDSIDIFKFEDKSCISSFIRVPRDTVICNKYEYKTNFEVKGLNKPSWVVNDFLTNLYYINDSTAHIKTLHEGKFIISFELKSCENTLYDTATVFFWRNPTISVYDSLYCGQVDDIISFSCFACSYLWNDIDNSNRFKPTSPGTYWVKATNLCGSISDTFKLDYLPYLTLNLGNDTLLCNNAILNLNPSFSSGEYLWNNMDTNSFRNIKVAGTFSLNFKDKCNNLNDTIIVNYKKTPTLNLGTDSVYCSRVNHSLDLDSVSKISKVLWWDSSTLFQRSINLPGLYYANLINECGSISDSIRLGILEIPKLDLGSDTTYCQDFKHSVNINPKVNEYKIEWWDTLDSLNRVISIAGIYSARIFNRCGQTKDSLKIERMSVPKVNLGKDTFLRKPFTLVLDAGNSGSNFNWNTSAITRTLSITDYGVFWVNAKNYCGNNSDTILVSKPLEISKVIFENKLNIFPNPVVDGRLQVELPSGSYDLHILNAIGQLKKSLPSCFGNFQIEMEDFEPGTYFIVAKGPKLFSEVIRIQKL